MFKVRGETLKGGFFFLYWEMNPLLHGGESIIAIIFKSGSKLSDLGEIISEEQRQMKMTG